MEEKKQIIISKIMQDALSLFVIFYLVLIILEKIKSGFVSDFFNYHYLAVLIVVLATILLITKKYKK